MSARKRRRDRRRQEETGGGDDDNGGNDNGGGINRREEEEETTPVVQLKAQLSELSKKHDTAMEAIATLTASSRSYVYVPRERHIEPFSGDPDRDGRSVEEFIEEVERVTRTRGQSPADKVDFILSLLKGSALEEIRLCSDEDPKDPNELFALLREAYAEKRSVAQLLQAFYGRQQREGEDIQEYSHALSQILRLALKQKPDAVADAKMAVRDQFIEGVQDSSLRRELRKMVREKPQSTLLNVREEAIAWSLEEKPSNTKVAKSRQVVCDSIRGEGQCSGNTSQKPTTLEDLVKVMAEQSKAIGELTMAFKESLALKESFNRDKGGKPRPKPQFTEDGKPICFRCKGVGHISKECAQRKQESQSTTNSASHQEN